MQQLKHSGAGGFLGRLILLSAVMLTGCSLPESDLSDTSYPEQATYVCAPGTRTGMPGKTDELLTGEGIRYYVRTPLNYDSRIAHPLMMVFSPGDRGGLGTEWFTGLTTEATRLGFIVVYADNRPRKTPSMNRPLTREWILELGTIPALVAAEWCIDENRIFLAGHSNGGTISTALALLDESPIKPAALAPSAAGFRAQDLGTFSCPEPMSVLVMHSNNDSLFPGYGAEAAQWWKQCNQCPGSARTLGAGCSAFQDCKDNVSTIYCEGEKRHSVWPERNDRILSFFAGIK
ncbi:MAG: poly(3-hydroxybutyrate) depolymerase [Gammaproteobacteria bacterium]|nr:poly(3-hydroxybutyrate) depolymerase [Gammaproteobacteria bacterium]